MGRKSSTNQPAVSSAALVKEKAVDAWNFDAFLAHIAEIHFNKNDIRFMFMLGAGASVSSGIPTGYTLAKGWLEDLYARYGNEEGIGAWLSSTPFYDLPDLTFENCGKIHRFIQNGLVTGQRKDMPKSIESWQTQRRQWGTSF